MTTQIFVNLQVKNLNKSIEFFTQLGYTFNPRFTDETATCMIVSEDISDRSKVFQHFLLTTKSTKDTKLFIFLRDLRVFRGE